jgi:hypothetical protein
MLISIRADEWAEMLRTAGAPEPWFDPNAAHKFAEEITFACSEPKRRQRTLWTRRKDAVDELRRVLPKLIEEYEFVLNKRIPDQERRKGETVEHAFARLYAKPPDPLVLEIGETRSLLKALPECFFVNPGPPGKVWHIDAVRLFWLYLRVVDRNSGTSGPAARFIEAALKRMGHSRMLGALSDPRGAIARQLQRWRKART